MFRLGPLDAKDARAILSWHYKDPYGFYDPASLPEDAALFLDEEYRSLHLLGAYDEAGLLRGFFEFQSEGGMVEVGLGLRPEDTGQGLGGAFLEDGLAYAQETLHPESFRLYVAAFNQRAITVYERAGFQETGRETRELLGRAWEFIEMRRPA